MRLFNNIKLIKKSEKRKKEIHTGISAFSVLIIVFVLTYAVLVTIVNFDKIKVGVQNLFSDHTVYTQEVKSVAIESSGYSTSKEGAWHIDKSGEWIDENKAQVIFDVTTLPKIGVSNMDILFIIDTSNSMKGKKIETLVDNVNELIRMITQNESNRIAIITFDDNSVIKTNFTNNKTTLLNIINNLTTSWGTNYNSAWVNVNRLTKNYVKEEGRELKVLFLSDGNPNLEVPNQVARYKIFKKKQSHANVYAIQYGMGKKIKNTMKEISNYQYFSEINTLRKVLLKTVNSTINYNDFKVIDYVNDEYFYLENLNDIEVSVGEVSLEEEGGKQKIIWNLGGSFQTGEDASMKIKLTLKDNYKNTNGYFPTNSGEDIESKIPDEEEDIESELTPVLKNGYMVNYNPNPPSGCTLENIASEEHYVYQKVTKNQSKLVCDGYVFQGFHELEDDLNYINDDVFVMPKHDVNFVAEWGKADVIKTMDGIVYNPTLQYKITYNSTFLPFSNNKNTNVVSYYRDTTNIASGSVIQPVTNSCNTFKNWYIDQNRTVPFVLSEHINETMTVYAGYTKNTFCFAYTGAAARFYAFKDTTYKLEVWGARGGEASNVDAGYGGYSTGVAALNNSQLLYVYVGGVGGYRNNQKGGSGGYNGGGAGGDGVNSSSVGGSGGGGATHIATKSGLLKSLSSSKSSILIVAGGGGGNVADNTAAGGGSGGGTKGGAGKYDENGSSSGGTQTSGAGFGYGAAGRKGANYSNSTNGNGGSGGGYYGGTSTTKNNTTLTASSGGGGSGYLKSTLTAARMYCFTGCGGANTTVTTNVGTHEANKANYSNGYAKITVQN